MAVCKCADAPTVYLFFVLLSAKNGARSLCREKEKGAGMPMCAQWRSWKKGTLISESTEGKEGKGGKGKRVPLLLTTAKA
jgi:hypothetical protein